MVTSAATARLLLVDLDDVVVLHLERLRSVVVVDSFSIKEKPKRRHGHTLAFAEERAKEPMAKEFSQDSLENG